MIDEIPLRTWLAVTIASIASPCATMPLRDSSIASAVRLSSASTATAASDVTASSRRPAVALVASIRCI